MVSPNPLESLINFCAAFSVGCVGEIPSGSCNDNDEGNAGFKERIDPEQAEEVVVPHPSGGVFPFNALCLASSALDLSNGVNKNGDDYPNRVENSDYEEACNWNDEDPHGVRDEVSRGLEDADGNSECFSVAADE